MARDGRDGEEGFVLYNYHYWLKIQAGSDRVLITIGLSHEPAVIYHNITAVLWLQPAVIRMFITGSLGPQSFLDFQHNQNLKLLLVMWGSPNVLEFNI